MPSDFKTIAKTIADGIKSGVYTETLPSIARLSEQFDVCPATVKRILAQLQDWDLVSGEHGRCVRINPKAEGNAFFHKNIVILISLYMISLPYFEETLTLLTNMLSKLYMTTHIFFTEEQLEGYTFVPDCILAVSNTSMVMLETLKEKYPKCPVVRMNNISNNYSFVESDNVYVGYEAIRQLADDCGHRHIGMIATQLQYKKYCFRQRYDGAMKYAAEHRDIKLSVVELPSQEIYGHASYHQMEKLMKMDPEITGVFASCDMLAVGVYSYAHQHNLKIPDDLAVIGCDNENYGKCLVPALTTFVENYMDVAQMLFQVILDAIQGKKTRQARFTTPVLLIKGSTRKTTDFSKE